MNQKRKARDEFLEQRERDTKQVRTFMAKLDKLMCQLQQLVKEFEGDMKDKPKRLKPKQ